MKLKYLLTANFLCPKYQRKERTTEHQGIIKDFIFNCFDIVAEGLNNFLNWCFEYKEETGLFKILFKKQTLLKTEFRSFTKNKHPELQGLINKLLNISE